LEPLAAKVIHMEKITVEQDIFISAGAKLVWEAITTTDQMKEWWADAFEIEELKAGARIHFGREDNRKTMTVLEATPPEKFVILWPTPPWYTNAEIQTIFDLKEEEGGTRIEVTETGFEGLDLNVRQRRIDGTVDTYKRMLGKLKEYVEYKASM
jgi:uncharacterized protein YndB with AHSA1/START domain